MRYGVDGKTGESRARLGTIGGDHLGDLGHEFGRNDQLRYHRPGKAAWDAVVGHGDMSRRQEPMRFMRASASQKASGMAKGSKVSISRGGNIGRSIVMVVTFGFGF
jgi:hypothetical protein